MATKSWVKKLLGIKFSRSRNSEIFSRLLRWIWLDLEKFFQIFKTSSIKPERILRNVLIFKMNFVNLFFVRLKIHRQADEASRRRNSAFCLWPNVQVSHICSNLAHKFAGWRKRRQMNFCDSPQNWFSCLSKKSKKRERKLSERPQFLFKRSNATIAWHTCTAIRCCLNYATASGSIMEISGLQLDSALSLSSFAFETLERTILRLNFMIYGQQQSSNVLEWCQTQDELEFLLFKFSFWLFIIANTARVLPANFQVVKTSPNQTCAASIVTNISLERQKCTSDLNEYRSACTGANESCLKQEIAKKM